MDHTNHWYGHAHALAEYCGFDPASPPPIRGTIQHGWMFVHGYGTPHRIDRSFVKLVWSDLARRRGQLIGWRDYAVIGSPFSYLATLRPESGVEPEGTIWYPFHGTKEYEGVHGSHQELVDTIRAVEDGPVTICLYYVEYDDKSVRQFYEDAGFRVICHGRRGLLYQGTDRFFLERQLTELRRHRRVASNRLTTAVMYGASLGLEPAVYGDPMVISGVKAGYDGTKLLDSLYPQFTGEHVPDVSRAQAIARAEVGTDVLLGPDELRYFLGWDDPWSMLSN